jgi:hypothetical protein
MIEFKIDNFQHLITLQANLWLIIVIIIVFCSIIFGKRLFSNKKRNHSKIIPIELTYNIGGTSIKYQIRRNYQNVEIAHRIFIELVTRKAALPINEEYDTIVEVYDSWYTLFQTVREELKKISGETLLENNNSNDLIDLLTDILNKGLRPHLTVYQAKFRKWYDEELQKDENKYLSPQQIQMKYENYIELLTSMKFVNQLLIEYSEKLKLIINN